MAGTIEEPFGMVGSIASIEDTEDTNYILKDDLCIIKYSSGFIACGFPHNNHRSDIQIFMVIPKESVQYKDMTILEIYDILHKMLPDDYISMVEQCKFQELKDGIEKRIIDSLILLPAFKDLVGLAELQSAFDGIIDILDKHGQAPSIIGSIKDIKKEAKRLRRDQV